MTINVVPYKWEDTAALDHKCGFCSTVLSSAKAKTTCFGRHEEPCPKFHKTLHYIGNSHKCDACRCAKEQAYKRVAEIVDYVQKLEKVDGKDYFSVIEPVVTPEEDNYARPIQEGEQQENRDAQIEVVEDLEDSIESLVALKIESTPAKKLKKKDRKAAKKLEKAGQRSLPHTQHQHDQTARVLEEVRTEGKPALAPANERINQANYMRLQDLGVDNTKDEAVPKFRFRKFFKALTVEQSLMKSNKERKTMIKKLSEAVDAHMTTCDSEDRETRIREEGYWRYVGRRTWQHMKENAEDTVWGTGENARALRIAEERQERERREDNYEAEPA
ncbi:MAG: hypothetical protein M1814_000738 [Vezdaea aestivalis]|nr:MAG: hypothetical protein M1814_000738 [Vezdaea aestivalis]